MLSSFFLTILLSCLVSTNSGDNRELVPQYAPTNLTLLEIKDRQVLIEWDPIDPQTVRGNFKGYLVRTWNHAGSHVYAFPPEVTKAKIEFFPFSKNFITVSARNEKYVGPPSDAISFDAPQIAPSQPQVLNIFTLSNKSVFIQWSKPTQYNGILLGYKIYCSEIDDSSSGVKKEVAHPIEDPDKLQAKLTGMREGVKYRIGVSAVNCVGESPIKTSEILLEPHTSAPPFTPSFIYKVNYTTKSRDEVCYKSVTTQVSPEEEATEKEFDYYDYLIFNDTKKIEIKQIKPTLQSTPSFRSEDQRCLVDCMVLWIPDVKNNPGEYFYLKYKVKGEKEYQVTEPEMSEDFIILRNFDACKNYEIVLTAVDGEYSTDSGILLTPSVVF